MSLSIVERIRVNPDAVVHEYPKSPLHPAYIEMKNNPDPKGGNKRLWYWLGGAETKLAEKLPAVRDADGSIRWRRPGETTPGEGFFSAGDIFGPPGSGKRSSTGLHSGRDSMESVRDWIPSDLRKSLSEVDHPLWEAVNAPRALITSMDLSGTGRQGLIGTARQLTTNPAAVVKNFLGSVKALGSEEFYQRAISGLEHHPLMATLRDMGLDLPRAEEAYAGTRALTAIAQASARPHSS